VAGAQEAALAEGAPVSEAPEEEERALWVALRLEAEAALALASLAMAALVAASLAEAALAAAALAAAAQC
jgi:hypothetical protein